MLFRSGTRNSEPETRNPKLATRNIFLTRNFFQTQMFDKHIKPTSSLFELNLKELWEYRDLIYMYIKRDIVTFYKQTIMGPLWFVIQPILTTVMFMFVFGNLAGLSTDGIPQPLFYFSGIILWSYFADCLTRNSKIFIENQNVFGKVYFPRLVVPI